MQEALTGARVFAVEGGPETAAAVVSGRASGSRDRWTRAPAFPEALRAVVRSATDPDPRQRPTMAGVHEAMARLVERRGSLAPGGEPAAAAGGARPRDRRGRSPARPAHRLRREPVRGRAARCLAPTIAVVVVALALAGAGWLGFRANGPAPR